VRSPGKTALVRHDLHQAHGSRPADQARIAFGFFFDQSRNEIRIEAVVRGILRDEISPLRDVGLPVGAQHGVLGLRGEWAG
jgi:hypothetical protein